MPWDFILIVIFLGVGVPLLGRRRIHLLLETPYTTKRDRLTLYISTIASQWLAVAVILWRCQARGVSLTRLGFAIHDPGLTTLVSIVLAALLLANQFFSIRRLAESPAEMKGVLPQLMRRIFPQDNGERLCFLGLAITVALCEEAIYRGFLQWIFEDWASGVVSIGMLGSALLFAIAHSYQGWRGVIATFVVAVLFSAARAWTGSLLPPVISHLATDLAVGLLLPARLRGPMSGSGIFLLL